MIKLFILLLITLISYSQSTLKDYSSYSYSLKLDSTKYKMLKENVFKSTDSDFTFSCFEMTGRTFEEFENTVSTNLSNLFRLEKSQLMIQNRFNNFYSGKLILGTNGRESSGFYIFETNNAIGAIQLSFPHKKEMIDKIKNIIQAIEKRT